MLEKISQQFPQQTSALLEIKNQHNTGYCFSFPVSMMLLQKLGVNISPISIAHKVLFSHNRFTTPAESISKASIEAFINQGAYFDQVIKGISQQKVCLDKDISSSPIRQDLIQSYVDLFSVKKGYTDNANFKVADHSIKKIFPNLEPGQLKKMISSTETHQLIEKLDEMTCKNKYTLPQLDFFHVKQNNFASMRDVIKKLILADRIASVSFFNEKIAHAVTLIGQQQVGNKCFFIFKNSQGNNGCQSLESESPENLICQKNGIFGIIDMAVDKYVSEVGFIK